MLTEKEKLKVFETWKDAIEDSGDKDGWAENATIRLRIKDVIHSDHDPAQKLQQIESILDERKPHD